ncbi:unnamed protein product [Penicillium camemberti]|uniref:Str. FM013 n=1 Tax=Penicillium camemberti (strain FM 013) TaxID=1429867 RepID=A0A0G4NSW6_PENC3|nr:unnamed protein product [Penicillium camemberti]
MIRTAFLEEVKQVKLKSGILTAKPVNPDESRRLQTLSQVEKLGTNQVHLQWCHRRQMP